MLIATNGMAFVAQHAPRLKKLTRPLARAPARSAQLRAIRAVLDAQAGKDMSYKAVAARHRISLSGAKRLRVLLCEAGVIFYKRRPYVDRD